MTIDVTLNHKGLVTRTCAPVEPHYDHSASAITYHSRHRLISCPWICYGNPARCPSRLAAGVQMLREDLNWEPVLPHDVCPARTVIRHADARRYFAIKHFAIISARNAQICFIPHHCGCQIARIVAWAGADSVEFAVATALMFTAAGLGTRAGAVYRPATTVPTLLLPPGTSFTTHCTEASKFPVPETVAVNCCCWETCRSAMVGEIDTEVIIGPD